MSKERKVLILGAGLAGLRVAEAAVAAGCQVMLISRGEGASPGIIGFNVPVAAEDSVAQFIADTEKSGGGIGNPALIRTLAKGSLIAFDELERAGIRFDHTNDGGYQLMKPLGCTWPRLVHSGNSTGPDAIVFLRRKLRAAGVIFLNVHHIATLLQTENRICGAVIYTGDGKFIPLFAGAVVLACGGGGTIYRDSTYPAAVSGCGYGLALEAGAELTGMEFIQFEPCRCIRPYPLGISTTLLAHGGILVNGQKREFLPKAARHCSKAELAFYIAREISDGTPTEHGGVLLDLRQVPREELVRNHVMYHQRFLKAGIDLASTLVEVAPAAHTFLGGVKIDRECRTNLPGLFAAGEVTGGVHGADRIGGNAATEVLVFGKIAGISAARFALENPLRKVKFVPTLPMFGPEETKKQISEILSTLVGVLRNAAGLATAQAALERIFPTSYEERQWLATAKAVVRAAWFRRKSSGVHNRID